MAKSQASIGIPPLRPLRKIGDTAFGEVWACKFTDDEFGTGKDNTVAVKMVSVVDAAAARLADRTIDNPMVEVEVGRTITLKGQHPHIVRQVDQLTSGSMVCLISEYCSRGDLYGFLDSRTPHRRLSEVEAMRIMQHILLGLQFLHETLGLAHRDLSLENVLLSDDDTFKLTDFALAVDVSKPRSDRAGKDMYMAPEVVAPLHPYDPAKADVWSLGIIWFIMLTGSAPLSIASPEQSGFEAVKQHGIRFVLKKWGFDRRVSASTIEVLDAMLQVDPQRRATLRFVLERIAIASGQ